MSFPAIDEIESPRLGLRPVHASDLEALMAVNGDPEVTRFLPYEAWRTLDDARAWLRRMDALTASGTGRQLVLERREDARVVGALLFFRFDEGSARVELGYVLGREHWGQGLMSEAVEAACAHAFSALGVRRIEAEVNTANAASSALLEKVGFTREGTARRRWVAKGQAYDTHLYGHLVEDWRGSRG